MPVNIHGKDYVTVAERVQAAHDDGSLQSIVAEVLSYTEAGIMVKATATFKDGRIFTGHAEQSSQDKGIAGQSPLEVAETSAVGRALGFAGYGSSAAIASADEVQGAKPARTAPPPAPAAPGRSRRELDREWSQLVDKADALGIPIKHRDMPAELTLDKAAAWVAKLRGMVNDAETQQPALVGK